MEKVKTKFLIEENLTQLFNYFADIGGLSSSREEHYSWVKAHPAVWPNYIYGLSFSDDQTEAVVKDIAGLVYHDIAPTLLITGPKFTNHQFSNIALNYNMKQVMQWSGMAKKIELLNETSNDFEIITIENESLLADWLKITETALFSGQLQHSVCYWELLKSPFIKLFLGFIDNKPVATTLLFINEKTAGIYMAATLPEFQRSEILKAIVAKALAYSFEAGCKTGVLQANKTCENLFYAMGFKEYCKFNIYWKIPKVI